MFGSEGKLFLIGGLLMRFDLAKGTRRKMTALVALSVSLLLGTSAFAQVKPGDFITPESAVKVKDLVSPGER